MKKTLLALALMSAPLAAQDFEVGLFVGQNTYRSQSIASTEYKPESKTVVAGRFGYSVVDFGPALFQLTAGYQPKVSTPVELNGTSMGDKYGHEYWSVGAMFNFKAFFEVGAGLEYRSEKLTASGPNTFTAEQSTTYGRPWARAHVGLSFPTPLVKPFVGVDLAAPLTSESANGNTGFATGDPSKTLKSLAPSFQVGIYGGIRF
jgi:hypothetical protein